MKPEDIAIEVKKEREETLSPIGNCGEKLFTSMEIAGEVWRREKENEEFDGRGKREIMASVIRNLDELCEERRIGRISAIGEEWYGTHQTIANLQQMIDEIKK